VTEPESQHLHLEVANRDPLSVRQFAVEERVSEPFAITVIARSPDPSLDLDLIVGHPATFRIDRGVAGAQASRRAWPGIVRVGSQEEVEPSGLSTYRFEIVPTLWLMTQRRDYRIVAHQSAPEIAAAILDSWGIAYAMEVDRAEHPVLPYKVQYGESDYAFFCRILEEAGISFSFPRARPASRC
jgi:type VI secretion system secreted protein VgrG